MTSDDNNNPKHTAPLLDDTDFTALIEAEFDAQNSEADELRKQKIWKNIDSRLNDSGTTKQHPAKDNPGITSFAVAAVLLIMIVPAMLFKHTPDYSSQTNERERSKGLTSSAPVSLRAFEYTSDGGLLPSTGTHAVGNTIVFKTETGKTSAAALLLSKNDSSPEIRFIGDINQATSMQLLRNNNKVYGYMVEPNDVQLRFCIVQANNKIVLQRKLRMIDKWWTTLSASSCVNITVPK